MKKFLIFLLFMVTALTVNAAKSIVTYTSFPQPDGTQISVHLAGDEYCSWYTTSDGALLVRIDNFFYIAQTNSDGTLTSTGVLAHNSTERTPEETTLIKSQNASLFLSSADNKLKAQRKVIRGYPSSSFAPHTGEYHIPIIMMEYPDKSFQKSGDDLKNEFDEYFNSTTKTPYSKDTRFDGYSSASQYFVDASQGKFVPIFDLYGPYTASHDHDYYGSNNKKSFNLMEEAVKKADPDIDFSTYDSNNDGYVDIVYILYAGTGANLSNDDNDFWPTCWYNTYISTNDGKSINVIGGANELSFYNNATYGTKRAGIGVFCHEMSHGLGLPDLYWTLGDLPKDAQGYVDPNNCGPEDWDLMDGGENLYVGIWPCQYTAWERDVMGWLDVEELTEPQTVTLLPLNKEGGKACRVTNPANQNEYYIIENYQSDEWNYYINGVYGSGLMITHVNSSESGIAMSPNNTYGQPNVTLLPADGFILAAYSKGKTIQYKNSVVTMPTNTNNEFFTNYFLPEAQGDPYLGTKYEGTPITSVTAYKNYSGSDMVTKYPITDITRNDDGSITFRFMGDATSAIQAIRKDADNDSAIYTINGIMIGHDTSSLPHGIYIHNGHKFVK